ncbi:hypothetical protein [Streptomyces sp. NBC_01236]|uniref:hypothetical protein n=1 Tax=Streptomyces sp. NBC_01236 TaxID=2903789 RepID=UPI002E15A8AD|nr:hypothetical protein OG324_29390 [Streptomyces sp. NBC_01236]
MAHITATPAKNAIATALEATGHPHPLLADEARRHPDTEQPLTASQRAIAEAVNEALAGLTTHPRDVAEQLHRAVDDASAQHLARPDVGDMQLDEARSSEALSTAWEAMDRALALSTDRALTARALRNVLNMAIAEAGE